MFRQLDYQDRVLTSLDNYLDVLKSRKVNADKVAALAKENPELSLAIPDFTAEVWERLKSTNELPASRRETPFSPRADGCGRHVPNIVVKVPTGGGKTWLAVSAVSRIMGRYLDSNHGFVLWVVPNEAIYAQTLKNLKNRQHPYRQALDRAAAGRVRVMEKSDNLDSRDVETNLCVMLLMLQASNRQNQETLKMFQDSGNVQGFVPPEGDQAAHKGTLESTPNLDFYDDMFPMVKSSLGNALRVIRPIVVMDEGHRAASDLAVRTLYGFNPCFVLELTATPKDVAAGRGRNPSPARYANVLVEITGKDLDREGMIKMPLNLDPRQGTDWRATLNAALSRLDALSAAANALRADTNRYIRPIMLVQVERTGAEQRAAGLIHAEDVREWLLTAGFDAAEIAIKTAQQNDLGNPENQDLLAPTNRVRAIITKQALQEGWDCPFAYVLCSLAASTAPDAMTQLVGRILRQPGAEKTGVAALDECYVITHHAATSTVVEAIKAGLEKDGLGDLTVRLAEDGGGANTKVAHKIKRRPGFEMAEIYLPKVMKVEGRYARELDYETDILAAIDWRSFDPADIAARIPENAQAAESQLQRLSLSEDGHAIVGATVAANPEVLGFDPAYTVRMVSDIVLNPFLGREIVGRLIAALETRGFDPVKLGRLSSLILDELRNGLDKERSARAERLFKNEVTEGRIQFRLRLDARENWRMPENFDAFEDANERHLMNNAGLALKKSLFLPVFEKDFNGDEKDVALHLDAEETLEWWHRNVARTQYGVQGWRKAKIYPDFIFAVQRKGKARRITVLETKGDQLDNLDTAYKRSVLEVLSSSFAWDDCIPAGELELVRNNGDTVEGTLILMSEIRTKLPGHLA